MPKSRVTALVEAQAAWHQELGTLGSVSSTIVKGLLVMPKWATPALRKVLRNHPSWEDDPAAQAALGPIIAKWLTQGVLEYVQWDDRQPVLLQPCGAVPKGSPPFYRLITDARYGNKMYSDWGVTYASAASLSAAVRSRDFTWSADLQDAYHLSVFAGCGGQLRPCRRPVLDGTGEVTWIDGFMVGCDPKSCLGGCDKDMSGISIAGHIFRFAACQFGQKTAGSPLNALVMSVAQYFARLTDPVHVAAWVDDLHFSMRTPDHPPCLGHEGGCATCGTAYDKAVLAEAHWRRKAKALNLPLSEGKGHSAAQGAPSLEFTSIPSLDASRCWPTNWPPCAQPSLRWSTRSTPHRASWHKPGAKPLTTGVLFNCLRQYVPPSRKLFTKPSQPTAYRHLAPTRRHPTHFSTGIRPLGSPRALGLRSLSCSK